MQQSSSLPLSEQTRKADVSVATSGKSDAPPSLQAAPSGFGGTPSSSGIGGANSRFLVIHAEKKRPPRVATDKAVKRMSPRLRQSVVLVTMLLIFTGTLLTLAPLSADQNTFQLPSGLNTLIHSAQLAWQIQSHQTNPTPVPVPTGASISAQIPPQMTLPTSQYIAIAQQDASSAGISPTYFVRQINLESGFNPNAVSPGGAEGIAQFEPGTAAGLGINPFDPIQALKAAAQMMANAYHQYGDYAKALAAYNAGSANMQAAVNACGANWLSCMSATTQNYVAVVMGT